MTFEQVGSHDLRQAGCDRFIGRRDVLFGAVQSESAGDRASGRPDPISAPKQLPGSRAATCGLTKIWPAEARLSISTTVVVPSPPISSSRWDPPTRNIA
jgi:hypothetical protein